MNTDDELYEEIFNSEGFRVYVVKICRICGDQFEMNNETYKEMQMMGDETELCGECL
jgi:hypothetical protein